MKLFQLFTLSVLFSCNVRKTETPAKVENMALDSKQLNNDYSKFFHKIWTPIDSNSSELIRVEFLDEYAIITFHGQCVYYFFTNKDQANRIQLIWSFKKDCVLDLSFLEQSNGVKLFPRFGTEFASYNIINDSTIEVRYNFKDWVDKVNQIANDSIFPKRLHAKSWGGL